MDTAELIGEDTYKANVESQIMTDGDSGINLIGRFDNRLTDDSSYRVEVGFGNVDFNVAAFYKWAPIPDTGNQPAMSVAGGVSLARFRFGGETANDLSLRAHPIISKRFEIEFGDLTPYGGIPIGLRTVEGDTDLTAQLSLGAHVKPNRFKKMSFVGELGFDLSEAFTYLSFGFTLDIDPDSGIRFE